MPQRRIDYLETLGKGGFGAVYLAEVHGRDDFVQRLAVKVLSAEMSLTADMAARQRDEARLLARLNHDHIVRVVDLTEVGGRPAVLMEYVEGADASQLLRAGPIPARAAIQIALATASALNAAWATTGRSGQPLRVIHRDIKPANLLVSRHGGVKVLDFGVARADFDREGITGSVQFGTARYMAPEQWLHGEATHKVDVYALGVTLVELLTSLSLERPPLAPDAFRAHMDAARAMVIRTEWPASFGHGVEALLQGMLAFEPDDRPDAARCQEVLADLADGAPGEALRRWAPTAVPPCIEARRQRWAAEEGPLGRPVVVPVPVVPVEATASAAIAPPEAPIATQALAPAALPDADPVDTLATTRPAAASARSARIWPWAALGTLGLCGVLAGILLFAWPGPPPAQPEAVVGLEALAEPADAAAPPPVPPTDTEPLRSTEPLAGLPEPPPSPALARPGSEPPGSSAPASAAPTSAAPTSAAPASAAPVSAAPESTAPAPATLPTVPGPALPSTSAAAEQPTPEPASSVAPAANTVAVSISSSPWGAEVRVDGRVVGTTPLRGLVLPVGGHELHLRLGEVESTHTVTIGGRNPSQYTWTLETNQWRSSL